MATEYQQGMFDEFENMKTLLNMSPEERYARFNDGAKISIETIFNIYSPIEFHQRLHREWKR